MADAVDYKHTILLPQTEFPMRANLAQREPQMLARWEQERLYERALAARAEAPRYVFHDGPPYANGELHYGHVLNKVLKDIVVKYQLMAGRLTRYVPGWDCHGLPIELQVERQLAAKDKKLEPLALRGACRKEAEKWVRAQAAGMRRLGTFATYDAPYLTMNPAFERGVLEALGAFVRHELVYRGKKPVHWCGHDHTALAEAEVEYRDHVSPSIYVKFPVRGDDASELAHRFGLDAAQSKLPLYALIWTTTPWTLPANLAIAVHPEHEYVAIDVGGETWIVADALAHAVLAATKREAKARSTKLPGAALAGSAARHPFEDRASPLYAADYVTLDTGTGLVHTAPGHGADDYKLGQEHGLPTFAPVDEAARFTDEVRPEWRGLHVLDANPKIVHFLHELGALANREGETLAHSYPCCWRCKNPVIFRATTQWFIALDRALRGRGDGKTLRQLALSEIDAIATRRDLSEQEGLDSGFIPAWGRERIHGMLADRPDWCISRQRVWGVPIPALHCSKCREAVLTPALVDHVAAIVGREGSDAWYRKSAAELAPPGLRCPGCGGDSFEKDPSILDVWFESGASFWSVLRDEAAGLHLPADLYLEGSDQHRGWFHSSLLIGIAVLGRAPYKRVLTHGFVCDEQGRPYSKSDILRRREAGEHVEYVDPEVVIKQQGAELMRLWVAYEDFRSDVRYSQDHIKQVSDAYFKIRNTLRFLLGNLHDFAGASEPAVLDPLDRWARARLRRYLDEVVRAYERYDFRSVYHRSVELCVGDWSSFYLDVVKDRLYCDAADAPRRRSCQATLELIARGTIAALAPITSFTADEAFRALPGQAQGSVFLDAKLEAPPPLPEDEALLAAAQALFDVRDALNLALEPRIKAKEIGHRREVAAHVIMPRALRERIATIAPDLAEALTVASVDVAEGAALSVTVARSNATQCRRCWRHLREVGSVAAQPDLCARCAGVLSGLKP